jgi:hypothetical protein
MPIVHVSFDVTPALLAVALVWDALVVTAAVAAVRRRRRPLVPSRG